MKKFTFTVLLLTIFSLAFSQANKNFEDPGFENQWERVTNFGLTYDDYSFSNKNDLLKTLNSLYGLDGDIKTELTAFKESNARNGKYAIKVVSTLFGNSFFVPGVFGSVTEDYIASYLEKSSISVRRQFSFKPEALGGYFKYLQQGKDSARIEVEIYNREDVIGSGVFMEYDNVSDWTRFQVPITYTDDTKIATHIRLLFISSAGYDFDDLENCKGEVGSALIIDDISFTYDGVNGLTENLMSDIQVNVFPNPATEKVVFEFAQPITGNIIIYDMLGAEVGKVSLVDQRAEYNATNLNSGTYLYRLIEGNKILTNGKFIVQ